jgi:hypothetical protein
MSLIVMFIQLYLCIYHFIVHIHIHDLHAINTLRILANNLSHPHLTRQNRNFDLIF